MIIYQIGHIVKHFNVSRRTLHFYHDLGLLSPSYIKDNGYRYYNDNDLIKLQTILSLKDLGLNLEEIKQFFNQNENSWLTLLEKQIDVVTENMELLKKREFILRSIHQYIEIKGGYETKDIFRIASRLKNTNYKDGVIKATFPTEIFTNNEIKKLENLPLIGTDDHRIKKTIILIKETRKAMRNNDEFSKELAEAWINIINEWFSGETKLQNKYFKYLDNLSDKSSVILGIDDELINYIDKLLLKYK